MLSSVPGDRAHIRGEGYGQRDPYSQPRIEKCPIVTSVIKKIKLFNGVYSTTLNWVVEAAFRGGDAMLRPNSSRTQAQELPEDGLSGQKEQQRQRFRCGSKSSMSGNRKKSGRRRSGMMQRRESQQALSRTNTSSDPIFSACQV